MVAPLIALFERDLNKLSEEIAQFKNPEDLWKVKPGVTNSAGNLVMHLTGNLNHFIGAVLGRTGYVRDREKEFSWKDKTVSALMDEVTQLIPVIKKTLGGLSPEDLKQDFPVPIGGKVSSTENILVHLYGHFNYHLGQINYLRRILENTDSAQTQVEKIRTSFVWI